MSVAMRFEVELRILGAFVDAVLARGFRISVSLERGFDVDEMLKGSTDKAAILRAAFEGDDCHFFIHESEGPLLTRDGRLIEIGWLRAVFGNDGFDVVSDYSTNIEELLAESTRITDFYDDAFSHAERAFCVERAREWLRRNFRDSAALIPGLPAESVISAIDRLRVGGWDALRKEALEHAERPVVGATL